MVVLFRKILWNIFFYICFLIFTLIFLSSLFIGLLFPQKIRDKICNHFATLWGKAALWSSGTKVKIVNPENIPDSAPYIIAFNHSSNFDIFSMLMLPDTYRAVMKKELLYIPVFGVLAAIYGNVPVDRKNFKKAVESLRKLKDKFMRFPVAMAITGTRIRTRTFFDIKLKSGPVVTCIENKIPLLPVTILNAEEVHYKGWGLLNPGVTIELIIHPLVKTEDAVFTDRKRILKDLRETIGKPIANKYNLTI